MLKSIILTLTLFSVSFSSFAESKYDSNTTNQIQSIFWLDVDQDEAIIYAKFEAFFSLKSFIDDVILTAPSNKVTSFDGTDKLLLMLHEKQEIVEVYFSEKSIILDGISYSANPEKLSHFKELNNFRIDKGDSITHQVLNMAIKNYGLKALAE
ncbi:hypothetical protein [Thalassotalea sp. ND16A]|uniref:hypothetical protein n=1 Tax=Thalassotalea sp. ND16A TaxID=1535422 RepID=UPI00051A881C|nr:hypothetical protein [Thalassotalea sp. ND16A]KGJ98350.1 hypothetical protein ND16A_0659 [Thalassotalea sp. ND16A]